MMLKLVRFNLLGGVKWGPKPNRIAAFYTAKWIWHSLLQLFAMDIPITGVKESETEVCR